MKPLLGLSLLTACWPTIAVIWSMFRLLPLAPVLAITMSGLSGERSFLYADPTWSLVLERISSS